MISKHPKKQKTGKKSQIYYFFFPEVKSNNKRIFPEKYVLDRKFSISDRLESISIIILSVFFFAVVIVSILSMFKTRNVQYPVSQSLSKYTDISAMAASAMQRESSGNAETDIHQTVAEPIESKRPISCWSDSFGVSASESITPYTSVLGSLVNRLVYNISVTDDDITMIGARQGSVPMYVAPLFIPGEIQPVEITLSTASGEKLTPHFDYNGGLNPCTINGVTGIISNINQKLYFTRSTSGADTIIYEPTQVVTRAMEEKRSDITIFFIGSDDIYADADKTLEMYQAMTNYLEDENKQFLIVSPLVGTKEDLNAVDQKLSTYFGNRYLNFRQYLLTNAEADYNLQLNEVEKSFIAQGELPEAFFAGRNNLETTINYILAQKIYDRLIELNSLS